MCSVSSAPPVGAAIAAVEPSEPHQPIIMPRFCNGNSGITSAKALDVRNAAPAPPITRAVISNGTVGASDVHSDPNPNSSTPNR